MSEWCENCGDDLEDDTCKNCNDTSSVWACSVFLVDKAFGGPEEGGWWYECGEPILQADLPFPQYFTRKGDAYAARKAMQKQLDEGVNVGRPSIGSVLSQGVYWACVQEGAPKHWPEKIPHYE